jgi:hypothetical protein
LNLSLDILDDFQPKMDIYIISGKCRDNDISLLTKLDTSMVTVDFIELDPPGGLGILTCLSLGGGGGLSKAQAICFQ